MRSPPADDQPGLRTADELVARERHQVGAGSQALAGRRLMAEPDPLGGQERAAAEIVDHDRAVSVGDLGERHRVRRLHEPGLDEVRGVHAKHEPDARRRVREDGLEVGDPGPVRRPDLDDADAGPPQDLGDPHAAPDLDELTARDGHAAAAPGEPDGEGDGRRVVRDDDGVLRPGQRDEVLLRGPVPCAAPAGRADPARGAIGRSAASLAASMAALGQAARPRFVWTMTPVALITGVGPPKGAPAGPSKASSAPRPRPERGDVPRRPPRPPAAPAQRPRPRAPRQHGIRVAIAGAGRAAASTRSTLGGRGRSVVAARSPELQVPLAGAHGSRTHRATPGAAPPVLKTGPGTGPNPLPGLDASGVRRGRLSSPAMPTDVADPRQPSADPPDRAHRVRRVRREARGGCAHGGPRWAGLGRRGGAPGLIAGLEPPDDAAVHLVAPDLAVIGTVDFFPPIVDDPRTFGEIAAANALSDVFAMGGRVLFALSVAAIPEDLPRDALPGDPRRARRPRSARPAGSSPAATRSATRSRSTASRWSASRTRTGCSERAAPDLAMS